MTMHIQSVAIGAALIATTASAQIGQTGVTGANSTFNNVQPSASIHYFIQSPYGIFGIGVPIRMFAFNYNPSGSWISCDGRILPIQNYQALFSQIGTQFGGDGRTTFAIPDLRGRTPIGADTAHPVGMQLGTSDTSLTQANLPSHTHQTSDGPCGFAGNGQTFSNMQPSLALNFSIAIGGIFPPRETGFATGPAEPFVGEVFVHAAFPYSVNVLAPANGQTISIASNTALFSLVGTYYGGDGRTTFSYPDFRARAAFSTGQGPGLTRRDNGEVAGSEFQSIDLNTMPTHLHSRPGDTPTQSSGAGLPSNTIQPALALTYCIAVDGVFPGAVMNDSVGYIGEIIMFAGNFAPGGYRLCDGSLLPVSENEALFALIGTTYGGDGVSTFAVPDLRSRIPVGAHTPIPLGSLFGVETVTLTTSNLAAHSHTLPCPPDFNSDGVLDFFDYLDFVAVFANQTTAADFNHDSVVDFFDYLDFVQLFSDGC